MRSRGLLGLLLVTPALSASAQGPRSPVLELSLQGAYYPYYLDWSQSDHVGLAAGLLIRPRGAPIAVELGASFVQQRTTTQSDAPHMRTLRALGVAEKRFGANRRTRFSYGLGVSLLRIDAQVIDCGDFPLCSEWAHADLTTVAPTGAMAFDQPILGPLALHASGRLYVGLKRWEPDGRPMLLELSLGLAFGLP